MHSLNIWQNRFCKRLQSKGGYLIFQLQGTSFLMWWRSTVRDKNVYNCKLYLRYPLEQNQKQLTSYGKEDIHVLGGHSCGTDNYNYEWALEVLNQERVDWSNGNVPRTWNGNVGQWELPGWEISTARWLGERESLLLWVYRNNSLWNAVIT